MLGCRNSAKDGKPNKGKGRGGEEERRIESGENSAKENNNVHGSGNGRGAGRESVMIGITGAENKMKEVTGDESEMKEITGRESECHHHVATTDLYQALLVGAHP